MFTYNFDKAGDIPKYEFLYNALKDDILSGKLPEGTKMPSKRAFAKDNHISITTVMNAYEQLLMEGYIVSRQRSGYYVTSTFTQKIRYQDVPISPPKPEFEKTWTTDFTINALPEKIFPFSTWSKIIRHLLSENNSDIMGHGNFLGNTSLRIEIAKFLNRTRGMLVSADCILIGASFDYLYSNLIRLLPNDSVYAVEDPGYIKIPKLYNNLNLNWVTVKTDNEGINMTSLEKSGASVLHTSPEHHYPLGTIMSARRRQQLLKWLSESPDRYIIEDDYDWEFRYQGRPIPALHGMDYSNRVIYINTFSKTMNPGIKISYMVLPEELMKKYIDSLYYFSNTSSNLEQSVLTEFIKQGYFDRHLNKTKKYCHQLRDILITCLKNHPEIPVSEINGVDTGTHLLLKLDTDMSDNLIKEKAKSLDICIRCLSDFCVNDPKEYEGNIVLNYSSLDKETIDEKITHLGKIFTD